MLIENIYRSLFKSSDYFRMVYPHLEDKYFTEVFHKKIFNKIKQYYESYSKQPNISDIKLLIESDSNISEQDSNDSYEFLDSLNHIEAVNDEKLLIKQTEEWCQQRALENAILESVEVLQNKKESKGSIEDKIKKALAVEFDVKIGMDLFMDAPKRYDSYLEKEETIPTDIELLNVALNGGFRKKALACLLGKTNVGKSLWLVHLACSFLKIGKNVLYVSAEMSESMITKRADANLLDVSLNEFTDVLDKKQYLSKIKELHSKTQGKLIVKEYATGSANANHIKNLLNEIQTKRGFLPDVVILDYLNIFSSSRLGAAAASNSYQYIKSIAEEFRGVAVMFDISIITATQTNRGGSSQGSDTDMTSTSESFGLPMTLDWMGAIIQTPELFEQNKYVLKVLKSRYNDNINAVYTIGVDRPKMKLINLEDSDQEIPIHIKDKLKQEQHKKDNEESYSDFDFN